MCESAHHILSSATAIKGRFRHFCLSRCQLKSVTKKMESFEGINRLEDAT